MKQSIKKIWLALCMTACLFVLAGCSTAGNQGEEIDPSIVMTMQQGAQQYLEMFSNLTDEELTRYIAESGKNKDYVMESAFKSWESVKDDLGAYIAANTAVVTVGDDGYIARIQAAYEQRNLEFTIIVSDDLSEIEGISFSPNYTTGEKMTKAALNTLMGMGIVFLVLIFISWLISMFKYINKFEKKMREAADKKKAAAAPAPAPAAPRAPAPAPVPAPAPAPAPAPVVVEEPVAEETDDTELIAVIAAAIAAAEGKTAANGLVVRSIRRVPNRNWK